MTTATNATKPEFYTARAQAQPYNLPERSFWNADRFDHDHLGIDLAPYFDLTRDDRVLVLGSCFARDSMHGMLQRAVGRLSKSSGEPLGAQLGHKYNAPSLLQALSWARQQSFNEDLLIELTDGDWFDGHLHPVSHQPSRDAALERHTDALQALGNDLQQATVAVLTFDNIEYFVDCHTNTLLNTPPPADLIDSFQSRFAFHRATTEETQRDIKSICTELWKTNPSLRIIAAVSPIPIDATFSGDDVLVANQLAKSTLIVGLQSVVREFALQDKPIQYCPTYELIALQPQRETVWRERDLNDQPDGRHLQDAFARRVLTPLVKAATNP